MNSTDQLSAPIRTLSSRLSPLLALLLISDGGTSHSTGPTLDKILFNQEFQNFFCIPDCPATLMQNFYYRNELLAMNGTDQLSAPFITLSCRLPPLLALLFISDGGTRHAISSTLANISFKQGLQHFLLCSRVPYDYHATVSVPTREGRFTL